MIRSNTDPKEWRYIDTKSNPADHASKGLSVQELIKSNWFSGPAFLREKEISFGEEGIPAIQIGDPEVRSTVLKTTTKSSFSLINCMTRFSDWAKAVGVVSYLKRFSNNKNKPKTVITSVAERPEAEILIFKEVQRTAFEDEITRLSNQGENCKLMKNSPLLKLYPFLDDHGLLRVGGRLEKSTLPFELKHPIILPRSSHITDLIIGHFRKKVRH